MNRSNSHNHNELLLLVAEGDQQAFQQLIYHYSERVFFHALTFVKSWHLAEEIVQDIFLRVWQKREKLAAVDDWDKYLFVLSKNYLINAMQKKAYSIEDARLDELEDKALQPDDQYANKELGTLLQKAIDHLPEQKKRVFEMIHLEGTSQEKVAQTLGIATRTVRWNLASAINEIKDFIHRNTSDTLILWLIHLLPIALS